MYTVRSSGDDAAFLAPLLKRDYAGLRVRSSVKGEVVTDDKEGAHADRLAADLARVSSCDVGS